MSEARELLWKLQTECRRQADCCEIDSPIELTLREIVNALATVLATQPEPGPAPKVGER